MTAPDNLKDGNDIEFILRVTPMDDEVPYNSTFTQLSVFNFKTECTGLNCFVNELYDPEPQTLVLGAGLVMLFILAVYRRGRYDSASAGVIQEAEEDYDSARSVTEIDNRILKSCFLEDKNILKPLWIPNKSSFFDIWQWRRQDLPKIFKTDGRVDIIKTKNISNNNLHGTKSFGFNTKLPLIDIDTISDINGLSEKLRNNLKDYKIISL